MVNIFLSIILAEYFSLLNVNEAKTQIFKTNVRIIRICSNCYYNCIPIQKLYDEKLSVLMDSFELIVFLKSYIFSILFPFHILEYSKYAVMTSCFSLSYLISFQDTCDYAIVQTSIYFYS